MRDKQDETDCETRFHAVLHDTPEAALDKLEAVLKGYALDLAEVVPLFADLLTVPVPEARYVPLRLTPQQQKQQTLNLRIDTLSP